MIINKASKCRLYPNKEQQTAINKTLGSCRYVYDKMLERQIKMYKRREYHLSYNEMQSTDIGKYYRKGKALLDEYDVPMLYDHVSVRYGKDSRLYFDNGTDSSRWIPCEDFRSALIFSLAKRRHEIRG